jgi:pyruvate formate lyase activating enzyme
MIFDIQHYAVHDGPGIRTLVFFKGCPLSCPWCSNPESQSFLPELKHVPARCRACGSCVSACSNGAISFTQWRPAIDRARCCECGSWTCVDACDAGALSCVGQRMTVSETMARIRADVPFYENSGGGATFSGGEPFAQPEFLEALLAGCRAEGIHTVVETCGHGPSEIVMRLEPLVDLFLYDVKVAERKRHRLLTGCDNGLIMANLKSLAWRCNEKIVVRVPLIPGHTDDRENLAAIVQLMAELRLARAEIEPYHSLGTDKYATLGRPSLMAAHIAPPSIADARPAAALFHGAGIACEIAGE